MYLHSLITDLGKHLCDSWRNLNRNNKWSVFYEIRSDDGNQTGRDLGSLSVLQTSFLSRQRNFLEQNTDVRVVNSVGQLTTISTVKFNRVSVGACSIKSFRLSVFKTFVIPGFLSRSQNNCFITFEGKSIFGMQAWVDAARLFRALWERLMHCRLFLLRTKKRFISFSEPHPVKFWLSAFIWGGLH